MMMMMNNHDNNGDEAEDNDDDDDVTKTLPRQKCSLQAAGSCLTLKR